MLNNLLRNISNIFKNNFKGNIELHEPTLGYDELKILKKCVKNRDVSTSGSFTYSLEKVLAKKIRCKRVIATNSGTSALHLALISLDIKKGDEVLMPSLNYIASANACLYVGAKPHFVDVDIKTLGIDVKKLEKYLKNITYIKKNTCINKVTKEKIKAIICLHTFGHPCEVDKIKKLAKKFNLRLIEDAAEGLGSYYKRRHVGTFGDVGILSFNGNKIITTGGGGAVITNNKFLANKIFKLSTIYKKKHKWKYEYDNLGYNYRMPSLNAAIGLAQMKKLNIFLKKKRNLFKKYEKKFINNQYFSLFKEPKNCKSNYWLQTILLNKKNVKFRDMIISKFRTNRIRVRPLWRPIHKSKYLSRMPKMNLDSTLNLENRIINLPSSPDALDKIK
jgi:perosamine synthetase